MDIDFASSDLRSICENPRDATKKLGAASSKKLQGRLADLMAVARLGELPAGKPHPLKGNRLGEFAISLAGGHRLVLEACDNPIPTTPDDATDWPNVTMVRIVFIGDYHE